MNAPTTHDVPELPPGAQVHLVGAGGAGMSALGTVLLERGHPVTGSDLRGGRAVEALRALGAHVAVGHDPAYVIGADVVVVSTAVPEDNPEIAAARDAGIGVWRRAQLLAALLRGQRGLLVAGTHGKTTTTAMATVALQHAGLDPSFAIGGTLHDAGTSAHHGTGALFVAEADESDGSFLTFRPDAAIVTNVELDHHDHWTSLDELEGAFRRFLDQRTEQAPAFVGVDDEGGRRLAAAAREPVITYGRTADAQARIVDVEAGRQGSRFAVTVGSEDLGAFTLPLPGAHNVANATAVILAARWADADLEAVRSALAGFAGTQRRFQPLGERGGVQVIDDYAHHPTELRAVLQAARQIAPTARLVAVFQPHRYSRTAALGAELGRALAEADLVVVTDVYGAGESAVPGVTGQLVVDAAREANPGAVEYVPSGAEVAEVVADRVRPGDMVLTLGAGDITECGPQILRRLERRRV